MHSMEPATGEYIEACSPHAVDETTGLQTQPVHPLSATSVEKAPLRLNRATPDCVVAAWGA